MYDFSGLIEGLLISAAGAILVIRARTRNGSTINFHSSDRRSFQDVFRRVALIGGVVWVIVWIVMRW